jgi:hypothetical protein
VRFKVLTAVSRYHLVRYNANYRGPCLKPPLLSILTSSLSHYPAEGRAGEAWEPSNETMLFSPPLLAQSVCHFSHDFPFSPIVVRVFFLVSLGGVRLSPLGTSATVGLLYQPRMIDDDYGAVGGMRISTGSRSTGRKPAPVPLCPPQIPHDLTWDRTRAAAVGSQRLTA